MYCDEFNELTEQIDNMSFNEQFTSAEGLKFSVFNSARLIFI
jgi:hypothetical protein